MALTVRLGRSPRTLIRSMTRLIVRESLSSGGCQCRPRQHTIFSHSTLSSRHSITTTTTTTTTTKNTIAATATNTTAVSHSSAPRATASLTTRAAPLCARVRDGATTTDNAGIGSCGTSPSTSPPTGSLSIHDLVDTDMYPLSDPPFVKQCRQMFLDNGLVLLPKFVRKPALQEMVSEARAQCHDAWVCDSLHDVHLRTTPPFDGPTGKTTVGSVAYDRLSPHGALVNLYSSDELTKFVAAVCCGVDRPLYRLADPLGACSVNVFAPGQGHFWHFDESPFTTTLMLQPASSGGAFEVAQVGDGLHCGEELAPVPTEDKPKGNGPVKLTFEPGTLSIFGGSSSLHRVTENTGDDSRLVAVLCFSETAGKVNSEAVREMFWGRNA